MSTKDIQPLKVFLNGKELPHAEETVITLPAVTDEVINKIQQAMAPKKKRFKKDCLCQKCCDWRKRRAARKPKGIITFSMMVERIHKAFVDSFKNSPNVFRAPIIGDKPVEAPAPISIGRFSSRNPQPQEVPREEVSVRFTVAKNRA